MDATPVAFYSEGCRLVGDYYPPADGGGGARAGVVLCHGYTGVKDLYLPDNARVLAGAGYAALAFDYKGWGESEGPSTRLAPHSRVADVQAALTFLGAREEVDAGRLGLYGTSYGGATAVWTAAIDRRARCTVSVVGIGHGERWMRSVRRPDEWFDLLERSAADRVRRAAEGQSELVARIEVLLPDRQSAALAAAARRDVKGAVDTLPLEFVDETLAFHPEWVVDRIAPRPVLFIAAGDDRLVPPEESRALYDKAGEPKRLVVLDGCGHYEVYAEPAFGRVMEETLAWFGEHLAEKEEP
ncbi:MAG: alpha/beta hydrolase [Defluviicoccus sp.]|nr:alpha/beta hydrolase [Defluviicoccus sp.]MDE0383454.1 alpha/beta hydrolase [Defluviicoccus sp.]